MDDNPQSPQTEPEGSFTIDAEHGLTRRDFVKVAAILTGSTLLLLSRCSFPFEDEDGELPPIPANFKRFILAEQSPTVATESLIVALGSQCPDLKCALWWLDDQEFQFFETVEQLTAIYTRDGRTELHWLD